VSTEDSYRFTTFAHAGFDILGPLSTATVNGMLDRLPVRASGFGVLDVGCGKGEFLMRVLGRNAGTGIGVEPNPAFADIAEERTLERFGPGRVQIVRSAFGTSLLQPHSFDLGICTGALHAFGDWPTTLRGMAGIVVSDGWALLGPGYWKQPPAPEYLAAIEAEADEQELLAPTLAAAEAAGWRVVACHESTPEEWDAYEQGYADNVRRWCDDHARDRDARPFRERIENWADAYARWGRDTMGYALILLERRRG
jgi:SAM-dependent methyltransferase